VILGQGVMPFGKPHVGPQGRDGVGQFGCVGCEVQGLLSGNGEDADAHAGLQSVLHESLGGGLSAAQVAPSEAVFRIHVVE